VSQPDLPATLIDLANARYLAPAMRDSMKRHCSGFKGRSRTSSGSKIRRILPVLDLEDAHAG
jgi:hypothetical protein